MGNKIALFIIAFLIWCCLRWPPDTQHYLVGIAVAAFVAILTGDLFTGKAKLFFQIKRYLWFTLYAGLFLKEWIQANIDIALRLARPQLSLDPDIIEVKTSLTSDAALTVLANTLTLTREMITVDIDTQKGVLILHSINARAGAHGGQESIAKFEQILKKIYEN